MEQRILGKSGLEVSSVGLGTMTWGRDTDIHEARDQFNIFREAGGTLIDTADIYSDGASEEIVGEFVRDHPEMVVSSKVGTVRAPRKRNTSRSHLLSSLDESLRRLNRSHIDIWHLHGWDNVTPLDESLAAAQYALDTGKVRYVGVSNYSGWQTATAGAHFPMVSTQVEYSLVQRGIEREVVPAALSHGIGVLAWSPLGRGVLTGKYRHNTPADSRAASSHFASFVAPYLAERPRIIVEALCTAADGLGLTPTSVALSWLLNNEFVASALVGARTAAQLRVILADVDIILPLEIHNALNEVSMPDRGYPEFGWNQS